MTQQMVLPTYKKIQILSYSAEPSSAYYSSVSLTADY